MPRGGYNFVDLTGRTFGLLSIIGQAERANKLRRWRCVCTCGTETRVYERHLLGGRSKSCGCKSGNRKRPFESLYNTVRSQALLRGRSFRLTFEQFVAFTEERECHYCGNALVWIEFGSKSRSASRGNLDRKDNSKDYEMGNVVVCCPSCNTTKSNKFSYEEFLIIGKALREVRELRAKSS